MTKSKPNGVINRAGFERIPGPLKHYRGPDGKEYTYRRAFALGHGESLERAVKVRGKFSPEFRYADQVRTAARQGKLVKFKVGVTKEEERKIASSTLRQLTRGHYRLPIQDETTGEFVKNPKEPERASLYGGKILSLSYSSDKSPNGPLARLLKAMGRKTDNEYDVGETP